MGFFWLIVALSFNALLSLVGGLLPARWMKNHLNVLLHGAAGVLMGTALFGMIPESLHGASSFRDVRNVGVSVATGLLMFHLIKLIFGNHASGQHGHDVKEHAEFGSAVAVGLMILLGDALHNMTDGTALASAFFSSVRTGGLASFSVIFHEIPQEVADYTILLAVGWSRSRALLALFLVQLSSFIGAAIAGGLIFWQGPLHLNTLLAFSAGGFLYIAAADLIPSFTRKDYGMRARLGCWLSFFCGGFFVFLLEWWIG